MSCYVRPLCIATLLLLSSCASTPSQTGPIVDVTAAQVQQEGQLERLKTWQNTLRQGLVDKPELDYPGDYALLRSIDQRVAQLQIQRVETLLGKQRVSEEGAYKAIVPLHTLQEDKDVLRADTSITAAFLPHVLAPIDKEINITNGVIRQFTSEAQKSNLGAERRATVYSHLYTLSGDKKWEAARDNQMGKIIDAINAAIKNGVYNSDVEAKVNFVRGIYPDKPQEIVDNMLTVYSDIFSGRFSNALAQGKPDLAYKKLQEMAKKRDYKLILSKLDDRKTKMANEYSNIVNTSIDKTSNLSLSYRWSRQKADVRRLLGLPFKDDQDIEILSDRLNNKYEQLKQQANQTGALGILYAIEAINPKFKNLPSEIKHQQGIVNDLTQQRLQLTPLRSRNNLNYGELLTAKISAYLTKNAPKGMIVLLPETGEKADLLFAGTLLESRVDIERTPQKKMLDVTVGQDKIPNPDYLAWLELPAKQRTSVEKPNATILVDKQRKVAMGFTLHRKLGTLAVSYRVVDVATGHVIFPDSITLQKGYDDESNSGFELGDVVVPYKEAKLPSDEELLKQMTQEMAEDIGKKLIAKLGDQTTRYTKAAEKFAQQNLCAEEVENLAKALTAAKNSNADEIAEAQLHLGNRAVSCF